MRERKGPDAFVLYHFLQLSPYHLPIIQQATIDISVFGADFVAMKHRIKTLMD
jgi:hypothetical protein